MTFTALLRIYIHERKEGEGKRQAKDNLYECQKNNIKEDQEQQNA